MSGAITKAAKPQLRGLLQNQIKKNLIVGVTVACLAAVAQKVFFNDPKIKAYSEFYKNYDIEKVFNTMRNKGIFDSCDPDN